MEESKGQVTVACQKLIKQKIVLRPAQHLIPPFTAGLIRGVHIETIH